MNSLLTNPLIMTPADDSKNPILNIDPLKIVDTRCCSGIQTIRKFGYEASQSETALLRYLGDD